MGLLSRLRHGRQKDFSDVKTPQAIQPPAQPRVMEELTDEDIKKMFEDKKMVESQEKKMDVLDETPFDLKQKITLKMEVELQDLEDLKDLLDVIVSVMQSETCTMKNWSLGSQQPIIIEQKQE